MTSLELFPGHQTPAGVFRGFTESGLEFHADLTLPYAPDLHNIPMHGQFLLVQLENPNEAVLGRIASLSAEGRLTSAAGEQFSIRAVRDRRPVPDDLREDYLKYKVNIRVLGVIRSTGDRDRPVVFVPSHRRLPHVGSPVGFASPEVIRWLTGHHNEGADLGFFALGEYIYSGQDTRVDIESWMQVMPHPISIKFPIRNLVSRRSFIFARAGFGKSNLNKLLFSTLYSADPTILKRSGRRAPVGTLVFDPDGEYFWPDDNGNPGFCDVPDLRDRLVVFTSRTAPSDFYQSFVAGGVKLDIRRLPARDVVAIAVPSEKQDNQNVRKIAGLNPSDWAQLVDLIDRDRNSADLARIKEILRLETDQMYEALAARSNMTAIVRMLHDRNSQLLDLLMRALSDGKLCVLDVSQLRGGPSLALSGLILRRIFDHNQNEFIKANPRTIPVIAVIEEAQSVLNERSPASAPYIEWVKEGRKYDLGAVMITQQPGSIPAEILSQGDNWFIFHLLAEVDLKNVKRANAHFSDDILSSLLNETIPGQGVFWSSVRTADGGGTQYPVPLRVLSFSKQHRRLDDRYDMPTVDCYAAKLRTSMLDLTHIVETEDAVSILRADEPQVEPTIATDPLRQKQKRAIEALRKNEEFSKSLLSGGIPWGRIVGLLKDALPPELHDRDQVAYNLVKDALTEVVGRENETWTTEHRGKKNTLFVVPVAKVK